MTQTSLPRSTEPVTNLGKLRAGFAGEILTPANGERYDDVRAVFNAMFDRRPAVIARATCDGDVVAALLFAQSARLPIAVRAGATRSPATPPSTMACCSTFDR